MTTDFACATHYTRSGESISHVITSIRAEARRAETGWEWMVCASISQCADPSACPACSGGHGIIRDAGTTTTRTKALAIIVDRVTLAYGARGIAAATIRVLARQSSRHTHYTALSAL